MFGEKEREFLNNLDINAFNDALRDNQHIFEKRIKRFLPFYRVLAFYHANLPRCDAKNPNKVFSTQDVIDKTLAFYKQLSPETYKRAKNTMAGKVGEVILHDPREFPHQDGERGKQLGNHRNSCGFKEGKKYIEIEPENHLSGYVRVAHELGHAGTQYNFGLNDWHKDILLSEIDSRFAELLITNYLCKNGDISEKEKYDLINSFTKEQKEKLGYCLCEANVMNVLMQIQEGRDITRQDLEDVFNSMNGPVIDSMKKLAQTENKKGVRRGGDFEYELQYVVGTIVATTMFGDFQEDKKYMKWYDKKFLDTIHKLSFEEGIIYIGNREKTIEEIRALPKEEKQTLFGKTMNEMLAEHLAFSEDNNMRSKQLETQNERGKE